MSTTEGARAEPRFLVDKAVFWPASAALLALVAFAGLRPKLSEHLFQVLQDAIVLYASWYYVLVVAIILVSVAFFSLSRFGDIKLGPDHAEPAYTYLSWIAMLFAAGIIAASLGFGVLQINSGLSYLFGIAITPGVQVLLILLTLGLAGVSVVMGLDAGIKRLSELNLSLAMLLLVTVLLAGPTVIVLQATIENFGAYIGALVTKTFNLYAYDPTDWLGGWTIFYWGWWLSWARSGGWAEL